MSTPEEQSLHLLAALASTFGVVVFSQLRGGRSDPEVLRGTGQALVTLMQACFDHPEWAQATIRLSRYLESLDSAAEVAPEGWRDQVRNVWPTLLPVVSITDEPLQ